MSRLLGRWVRNGYEAFEQWRNYGNSRRQAVALRKEVVKHHGYSCLTPGLKQEMKQEMRSRFGDEGHWVWIALYTEMKGKYLKGWIPYDLYKYKIIRRVNPCHLSDISTIKSFDHRIFKNFSLRPLALYISGRFYDSKQVLMSNVDFIKRMEDFNQEVIIKPDSGPSGSGHRFIWSNEISLKDFKGSTNYVIQPVIQQHDVLSRLSLKSVNTLRITTFLTNSGDVQFKYVILRFGVGKSRVDNMVAGGWMIFIDQEGNVRSPAYNHLGVEVSDIHPDTGLVFSDIKIPGVRRAVQKCIEAHQLFPYLRFIAWDVCIDLNANPVLLEWNARCPDILPEEALLGPIWSDEEVLS